MKKTLAALFLIVLLFAEINAQTKKHKAFTMVKGDSLAIFLVNPLSANEEYNVYRKADTGYVLLTSQPIKAVLDPTEARVVLGGDWILISKAVDSDNEVYVARQIRSNTFRGAILSLISIKAAQVAGRWFLDTDIKKGKEYTYKLIFKKSGRVSDSLIIKAKATTIIPEAPSELELTPGNKLVKLEWNYPKWKGDFSDVGFTYNVYRKEGSGKYHKVNEQIIIRDDNSIPQYEDLWLKEGVKYTYKVTISDLIGNESKPSNEASVLLKDTTPPSIVTGVFAQRRKGKVNISWNISPQLDVKGYNVFRGTKLTGKFIKLTKQLIPFDKPFFVDSLSEEKKQYFYTVSAVDSAGNVGDQSNPIGIYFGDEVPPVLNGKLAYKIINNKVQLKWQPSKAKDVLGYYVYRSERPTGMKSRITLKPYKKVIYTDSGENNKGFGYGAKFYYCVTAVDSSGNESDSIKIVVSVPDIEPPLLPNDFRAENKGDYVLVSCGASPSLDANKYIIYKAELGKKKIKLAEFNKTPIYYTDTLNSKGTSYVYSVTVVDTAGNVSKASVKDSIIFKDFSPPPAPRNVKARFKNNVVKLTWVESIDFDMAGYNIYRADYPSGDYKLLNKKLIKEASFTDKTGNKNNFYRIKAVDTSGNESKYDETVSVK
jgi:hypothetical protein